MTAVVLTTPNVIHSLASMVPIRCCIMSGRESARQHPDRKPACLGGSARLGWQVCRYFSQRLHVSLLDPLLGDGQCYCTLFWGGRCGDIVVRFAHWRTCGIEFVSAWWETFSSVHSRSRSVWLDVAHDDTAHLPAHLGFYVRVTLLALTGVIYSMMSCLFQRV